MPQAPLLRWPAPSPHIFPTRARSFVERNTEHASRHQNCFYVLPTERVHQRLRNVSNAVRGDDNLSSMDPALLIFLAYHATRSTVIKERHRITLMPESSGSRRPRYLILEKLTMPSRRLGSPEPFLGLLISNHVVDGW